MVHLRRLTVALIIVGMLVACTGIPTPSPTNAPTTSATPTEEPFYAPDFSLETLTGDTITLSEQRGKWVLVNFWATWCAPCVIEMPVLDSIARDYADELVVLGINQRETRETITTFLTSNPVSYPILINPDDATLANYLVMNLPQTLLVDPNGEIQWRQFGPLRLDEFEALLDNFLTPSIS